MLILDYARFHHKGVHSLLVALKRGYKRLVDKGRMTLDITLATEECPLVPEPYLTALNEEV